MMDCPFAFPLMRDNTCADISLHHQSKIKKKSFLSTPIQHTKDVTFHPANQEVILLLEKLRESIKTKNV